eukprot:11626259-Alexandrium_andersonii.AAC.1
MAEQQAGSAAAAAGQGSAANPPAAHGGHPRGLAGFWMPLFGPPYRPGGPPRTVWPPSSQLL